VRNPIARLLLGRGTFPEDVRAALTAEHVRWLEEGLRGSVTYRHYRAPGKRSNWRREWVRAAFAVTGERVAVYLRGRPFVNVPFTDPRFANLEIDAQDGAITIGVDAAEFNARATGRIEVRVRSSDPQHALTVLRTASTLRRPRA
jgi:hypothetical protein